MTEHDLNERGRSEDLVLTGGTLLLPEGFRRADVGIRGGVISRIQPKISPGTSSRSIDAAGKYVLPGLIDIHTNGIAGFDLTNGQYDLGRNVFASDREAYLEGLEKALRKYAERGVTRAILTSLASPVEQLKKVFGFVNARESAVADGPWKNVFGGLYVEGTFMKMAEYSGAHNPDYFNPPSEDLFDELQDAAGGLIRIVNIVPEWDEPGLRLTEALASRGIVCAAGHTGATGNQYDLAVRSGVKLAVHFLNGPIRSSTKPFGGGGAVESVLRNRDVFAELITDGYHVDKSYAMDTIERKGPDRVVVMTDSMFTACAPGIDSFRICGIDGRVSSRREYVEVAGKANTLFGSMLTMDVAFSNILNWLTSGVEGAWRDRHEPIELEQAFLRASEMCSSNPARILGIFEPASVGTGADLSGYTGSIEAGKSADLVLAALERPDGKYRLKVEQTFVKGRRI